MGRRDKAGQITKAYGLDLSPLRARHDEIQKLADEADELERMFEEGRYAISACRRYVSQALAQAAELGLTGGHWIAFTDAMEAVASAARV